MAAYYYSFEKRGPREYLASRFRQLSHYIADAHALFDILQRLPERPVPLPVLVPDKVIRFAFAAPLSDSALEQLASQGYSCTIQPEKRYEQAA